MHFEVRIEYYSVRIASEFGSFPYLCYRYKINGVAKSLFYCCSGTVVSIAFTIIFTPINEETTK